MTSMDMQLLRKLCAVFFLASTPLLDGGNAIAASFDCLKATAAEEHLICSVPALSALDEEMAKAFAQARSNSSNKAALLADQRTWLRSRRVCLRQIRLDDQVECLTSYMEERRSRLIALVPSADPSTPTSLKAETLGYGSRVGMDVTIVKKINLGTPIAKIVTVHTRANAVAYCRDYVGEITEKCISEELATPLYLEINANCLTGKFTTLTGEGYKFEGVNLDFDPTGFDTEYIIKNVSTDERLDPSMASGYAVALQQFTALCPNRVQSD